jgi:hypothetical protein
VDSHTRTCEWCKATTRAASGLRSKKLGKHERRLLVQAAPPGGPASPIVPPGPSHTDQTATRRAVATLRKAGLIIVAPGTARITADDPEAAAYLRQIDRKYAVLRFAWRTPFGEEIFKRYRSELESGARLRWQIGDRVNGAKATALAACPDRTH